MLDGVSAFLRVLSPLVSPCLPSCFPLSHGVSAFPMVLSPLVPSYPLLVSLCWMVCPPSRKSCLPLSPFVSLLVSLCWMVCSQGSCLPSSPHCLPSCFPLLAGVRPPSRGSCLPLCPLVSPCVPFPPLVSPCVTYLPVGWCARLPQSLVSPCFPSCFPLLDGVSTFRRGQVDSPCLALSPFLVAKRCTVRGS